LEFLSAKLEEISAKNTIYLEKIRRNDEMWDKASKKKEEIEENYLANKKKLLGMDSILVQVEETIHIATELTRLLALEAESIEGMSESAFAERYPNSEEYDSPNMSSMDMSSVEAKTSIEGTMSDSEDEGECEDEDEEKENDYANATFASCTAHQSMVREIYQSCSRVDETGYDSEEARSVDTDEDGAYIFPDSDDEDNETLEIMLVKTLKGRCVATTGEHRAIDKKYQRKSMSTF